VSGYDHLRRGFSCHNDVVPGAQSQQQHKDLLAAALYRLQRSATPLSPRDSALAASAPAPAPAPAQFLPQEKELMSLMNSLVVEESGGVGDTPKRNYSREGDPPTPGTDLRAILHKYVRSRGPFCFESLF
jgi:hypothetical protein